VFREPKRSPTVRVAIVYAGGAAGGCLICWQSLGAMAGLSHPAADAAVRHRSLLDLLALLGANPMAWRAISGFFVGFRPSCCRLKPTRH